MKNYKEVNYLRNYGVTVIEIEGEGIFALDGFNGEKYYDCWKCDINGSPVEADKYVIRPEYEEVEEDEFEVIKYIIEGRN